MRSGKDRDLAQSAPDRSREGRKDHAGACPRDEHQEVSVSNLTITEGEAK